MPIRDQGRARRRLAHATTRSRARSRSDHVSFRYDRPADPEADGAQPFALTDISFAARAGPAVGAGRAERRGQDDDHLSRAAPLRCGQRRGRDRRPRRARRSRWRAWARSSAWSRRRPISSTPRSARTCATPSPTPPTRSSRRAARAAAIHDRIAELPENVRHRRRRARLQALRRREAAHRHRARHPEGPAHPDPGRGDQRARHALGAADPGGAGAADGRPHDHRHRAPALARSSPPTRSWWSDGGRIVERGTHAELLEHGGLYARLYREQFIELEHQLSNRLRRIELLENPLAQIPDHDAEVDQRKQKNHQAHRREVEQRGQR